MKPADACVFMANLELASLNRMACGMREDPIVVEVAKAVTVAATNPGVEARVICTSATDEIMAVLMLRGKMGSSVGGEWSTETKALEFPNGSCVVVKAVEEKVKAP